MKRFDSLATALWSLAALFVLIQAANGQAVISVIPGYIHFADGKVLLDGEPFQFNAAEVVHLGAGQRLRTLDGRAEVMIVPGSFIRLAPHSEIEMLQSRALLAEMRLIAGAAAVDLAGSAQAEGISVAIGGARVRFVKSGLYRIDAPADGDPVVRVVRGKAEIELHGQAIAVGGKHELMVVPSGGKLKATKTGKLEEDELGRWNTERRDLLLAESRKQNRKSENARAPQELSPSHDCRACRVAPGRDPNTQPRTRPPGYPLAATAGELP